VNEDKNAGRHDVSFSARGGSYGDARDFPAGIYFARIAVGGNLKDSKKLICVK
jgi:hypothetical protein